MGVVGGAWAGMAGHIGTENRTGFVALLLEEAGFGTMQQLLPACQPPT